MTQSDVPKLYQYVKQGLNADCPVSLIMHWNSNDDLTNYEYHWMTITEINYDENQDTYMITVSTWGKAVTLNFKDIWADSTYAGIMYFQ